MSFIGKNPPNNACTRLVRVCAFSGSLCGLKLVPAKVALPRPAHQRVTPAVGLLIQWLGNDS
jgi:hypothetical protein